MWTEVDTRDFILKRAHQTLRDIVWEGNYEIKPHAVQHARAQGFLEPDIVYVLERGRIRAVYPEDSRWLLMGYFKSDKLTLPMHVIVDYYPKDFWVDVVTAYVPKNPYHIMSRARVATLLRFDQPQAKSKHVKPHSQKSRWRRV